MKDCNDGKQHVIELLYEVSFKNDSRWNDLFTSDVTYTNSAKWGNKPAAIKTTVHKGYCSTDKDRQTAEGW